MATDLALIEPIKPPDRRRPATLPSLPAWLARSSAAVKLELQINPATKGFQEVLVLPAPMMPGPAHREEMTAHVNSLRSYLAQTPAADDRWDVNVATSITKLTVLPGEKRTELGTDAWSEIYLAVLDDVPHWAVEAAVMLWFKHACGVDERGKPYNYGWAPDPGTLRKIALEQSYGMAARIGQIQRVLDAREYVDCSKQLQDGQAAMSGLNRMIKAGDLEGAKVLTFEQAAALGNEPDKLIAPPPPAQLPADAYQEAE
jgi:hypothetical protein